MNQKQVIPQMYLSNRRNLLKMSGATLVAALSPSLASASAPVPSIAPLQTEFVLEAEVSVARAVEVGPSSHGVRRYIPITGGTFIGPKLRGTVLSGGADWQTDRPDGVTELDALYSIKTNDGAVIIVRNRGILVDGGTYFRTAPQFEAPNGPYGWLNRAIFVGSVTSATHPDAVVIRVFKVL